MSTYKIIVGLLIFPILTSCISDALGQEPKSPSDCLKTIDTLTNREVFKTVEVQPRVIGGMAELLSEVGKILKAPKDFHPIESKIFIAFIVEDNGEITGLRTIKNIEGTTMDKQFIEVVKKSKWEPGTCKGLKVPTLQVLPLIVDFK
jgi:hypothetical protein